MTFPPHQMKWLYHHDLVVRISYVKTSCTLWGWDGH